MGQAAPDGLIGRADDQTALADLLARTIDGQGGAVLLTGEPGIGKTRLAEETADRGAAAGLTVAWGRCRESAGAPPFWPWVQVLRRLGSSVLGGSPAADDTSRFQVFEAVTGVLAAAANTHPMLVVLDDVHRADDSSLRLLGFVTDQLWPARLGMVIAYRDGELGATAAEVLDRLSAGRRCRRLALAGLTPVEVGRWLAATDQPDMTHRVREVHERTGGNPFFIAEVIRLLATGAREVPDNVRTVIRRRVAALPDATRDALEVASVLGRDFTDAALAALLTAGPTAIDRALAPAATVQLIRADPDRGGRYRFVHVLTQETLESDLDPATRVELHARALAVLPSTGSVAASQLAHHAVQAHGALAAAVVLDAVREAAEAADRQLAWEDAAGWWRQADEFAVTAAAPASEQARIGLRLGYALLRSGRVSEARRQFETVADGARRRKDDTVLAQAALAVGHTSAEIAPDQRLLALLDTALAADGLAATDRIRLSSRRAMATYWTAHGRTEAQQRSAAAVQAARAAGDARALGEALIARHFTLRGPDDLDERLALGEEVLALSERLADDDLRFRALQWLIPDRFHAGDLVGTAAAVDTAAGIAEARRDPLQRWWVLLGRTLLAGFAGDWAATERLALEARALGRRLEQPAGEAYAVAQLMPVYRRTGRLDELEADLRATITRFPGIPTLSCTLALLLAETGRRDAATALVEGLSTDDFRALPRDQLVLAGLAILGETVIALDEPQLAEVIANRLAPYADRNLIQGVQVSWGSAAWHLARLLRVCGDVEGAHRYAGTAQRLHRRWGASAWGPPLAGLAGPRNPRRTLSTREREVLRLLAAGRANREIAANLHVSVHTVERHVANIFGKLGTRNRAEATAWAHHSGMVN